MNIAILEEVELGDYYGTVISLSADGLITIEQRVSQKDSGEPDVVHIHVRDYAAFLDTIRAMMYGRKLSSM